MNNIDIIGPRLLAAKERVAQAQREYDTVLAEWLEQAPARDEGAVKSDGNAYRITTTYGVNRTIDAAALDAVRAKVPAGLFEQAIEYAPKIKLAGLRYLRNNEPETYALLAQAITAKPAKPSVKVERMVERMDAAREAA